MLRGGTSAKGLARLTAIALTLTLALAWVVEATAHAQYAELKAAGERVGRKRVARLMREKKLVARMRRRFRITTDSKHGFPIAPNVLERDFTASAPDRAWVTDITFL